eukprot:2074088-Rhodomonas_salina.4
MRSASLRAYAPDRPRLVLTRRIWCYQDGMSLFYVMSGTTTRGLRVRYAELTLASSVLREVES